jgi:hypothetical protein
MINVSQVITSPMMAQPFSVYRKTGTFGRGGWIPNDPVIIPMTGIVVNTAQKDLIMVPEGDRIISPMSFFTTAANPLYTTHQESNPTLSGISDEILWSGEMYRVYWVQNFASYGYWHSIAGRMQGS